MDIHNIDLNLPPNEEYDSFHAYGAFDLNEPPAEDNDVKAWDELFEGNLHHYICFLSL